MARSWLAFVLLALTAFPAPASAKCALRFLSAWPEAGVPLPVDGRIVLTGFGADQPWVQTLGEHQPTLTDGVETVPLSVVEVNVGEAGYSQAVLVPKGTLSNGHRYRLQATAPGDDPAFVLPFSWEAGPALGSAAPEWKEPPRLLETSRVRMGCGPEVFAHVEVKLERPETVRVLAALRDVKAGKTLRYVLPDTVPADQVSIGHGMCGGAFELQAGVEYALTLWAVDLAGHTTAAPGPELRVVGPSETLLRRAAPSSPPAPADEGWWDGVKKFFGK
jgi:hypothetical protein